MFRQRKVNWGHSFDKPVKAEIKHAFYFSCSTRCGPSNLQKTGTFPSRNGNALAKWYLYTISKSYAGTRIMAFQEPKRLSLYVFPLLFRTASNLSLCWNRFLRRIKTKYTNTVMRRRRESNEVRLSFTPHFWFICVRTVRALLKLRKVKYNLTLGNNYRHFVSRLRESANKTPSGMFSETTGVVKTQPWAAVT